MSDLISMTELLAVADDELSETPPLPELPQRRALRLAADVPLVQVAAAVGLSGPTMYRAEMGGKLRSASAERRWRRVLHALARRIDARDPHALAS
jgi:hypothetical protein